MISGLNLGQDSSPVATLSQGGGFQPSAPLFRNTRKHESPDSQSGLR